MSLIFTICLLYNRFLKYRYFRILEATTSGMICEAMHAGEMIACRIKLMTKRPANQLKFDELWIDDRLYKIKVTNADNQQIENHFGEKQILFIDAESEVYDRDEKISPAENSKFKIFLGYCIDNRRRYLPIDTITGVSLTFAVV